MNAQEKIVFVLPQLKTGGGVRVITELSNVLVKKYDVRIVIPFGKSECTFYIDPAIKIEAIGEPGGGVRKKVGNIVKMFRYVQKRYRNEKVITTDPIFSALFFFFPLKRLCRYVQADDYRIFDDLLLLKNRFFLTLYKMMTKLSYRADICYFFNSTYTWRQFVRTSGREVPKKIVHPAINHAVFHPRGRVLEEGKLRLCLIARKHPMKRFEDFVTVWERIKQIPEVRKKIAGVYVISHDDLSAWNLEDFTMVVPQKDEEIADTMRRSDIYIFTSLWEGFGLPPLEAMACGCAVVASDAKGIDEYAIDGKNALIYPPADTEKLQAALLRLIEDESLRSELSQNAIETARNFSWERSAQALEKILKEYDA